MNDDDLYLQITNIAKKFKLFQCQECANAIIDFLIRKGKAGIMVKLYTGKEKGKYGNIYHDKLGKNISTNGYHVGVAVIINKQELIFDNIHPLGINRQEWFDNFYCIAIDLGSGFKIIENEF